MPDLTAYEQEIISSQKEASKRTRYLLGILALASIITFTSFLNSFSSSWVRARYSKLVEIKDKVENLIVAKSDSNFANLESIKCLNLNLETILDSTSYFYDGSFLYERKNVIKNYGDLLKYYEMHADLYKDMLQIQVPFLGITFDWNYIPIFSSLCFIFIYFLLLKSMKREYYNLEIIESDLVENPGSKIIRILALNQLLFTSINIIEKPDWILFLIAVLLILFLPISSGIYWVFHIADKVNLSLLFTIILLLLILVIILVRFIKSSEEMKNWNKVSLLYRHLTLTSIIITPILLQIFILYYSCMSFDKLTSVNSFYTNLSLCCHCILILIIVFLIKYNIHFFNKLGEKWENFNKTIHVNNKEIIQYNPMNN